MSRTILTFLGPGGHQLAWITDPPMHSQMLQQDERPQLDQREAADALCELAEADADEGAD